GVGPTAAPGLFFQHRIERFPHALKKLTKQAAAKRHPCYELLVWRELAVCLPFVQAAMNSGSFRAACAGGIHRHQQDAMERCIRRPNQSRDFFLTEYSWEVTQLLGIGRLGDAPVALQHVDIEETQRR